jgi:hypothetical protein
MEKLLIDQVWISMVLTLVVYIVDYYLGLYEAYLYHNHAKAYIVFDGRYDGYANLAETGRRKWLPSTSLITVLVVVSVGIYVGWQTMVKQYSRPEIFSLILGGLLLFRVAKSLIHFRAISLYRFAQRPGEISGKILYSKRCYSTILYQDFFGFVLIFFLIFLIQGGWFLLGGIFTCFIAASRHRDWTIVKT